MLYEEKAKMRIDILSMLDLSMAKMLLNILLLKN